MRPIETLCFLVVFVLLPLCAQSAGNEAKEPIYIESDAATYDEKTGKSIYTGNVQVTQGALRLNSSRLVVHTSESDANKVQKFVATGNPVHLKQTPADGKDDIRGISQIAEYHIDESKLILLEKAEVWQGESTHTTSERIEYDTKNSIVTAGEKNSSSKRVHVTLHPK